MNMFRIAALVLSILLTACGASPPQVLGTLERDRITLPSPIFERIADIRVREGAQVKDGDLLMTLESARSAARVSAGSTASIKRR